MDPTSIPDKLYFKIGEVAAITGVKPHVLRYWEAEISAIRPVKSRSQQRLYQRRDIELILRLKELLYKQGFTISGARKHLRAAGVLGAPDPVEREEARKCALRELRAQLQHLRDRLDDPPGE